MSFDSYIPIFSGQLYQCSIVIELSSCPWIQLSWVNGRDALKKRNHPKKRWTGREEWHSNEWSVRTSEKLNKHVAIRMKFHTLVFQLNFFSSSYFCMMFYLFENCYFFSKHTFSFLFISSCIFVLTDFCCEKMNIFGADGVKAFASFVSFFFGILKQKQKNGKWNLEEEFIFTFLFLFFMKYVNKTNERTLKVWCKWNKSYSC